MRFNKFIQRFFHLTPYQFIAKVKAGEIGFCSKEKQRTEAEQKTEPMWGFGIRKDREQPSDVAIILRSEIDYISRCILDYPHIETGGQLFGYWSAKGVPVVLYVIGPGPRANHESTFFNQDVDYLVKVGRLLNERYGLHHIGEWHSHHQIGLAQPSGHDASTMGSSIRNNKLGRSLLCIGNCTDTTSTLNAYNFTEECGNDYVHAKWIVKESEGMPYREIIDQELRQILCHPRTRQARHGELYLMNQQVSSAQKVNFANDYWLNREEYKDAFKRIYLKFAQGNQCKCTTKMDERKHLILELEYHGRTERFYFPERFPDEAPIATFIDRYGAREKRYGTWLFDGNIYESFVKYYNSL